MDGYTGNALLATERCFVAHILSAVVRWKPVNNDALSLRPPMGVSCLVSLRATAEDRWAGVVLDTAQIMCG